MPNDVINTLIIEGDIESIVAFKDSFLTIKKSSSPNRKVEYILDFDKIIPTPKGRKGLKEASAYLSNKEDTEENIQNYHKNVDWYSWCIEHWGTKWNSYGCHIDDVFYDRDNEKVNMTISFCTANAPCIPVIEELISRCEDMGNDNYVLITEYQYEEGGNLLLGGYTPSRGWWNADEEEAKNFFGIDDEEFEDNE